MVCSLKSEDLPPPVIFLYLTPIRQLGPEITPHVNSSLYPHLYDPLAHNTHLDC